jgi:hypothetical protein
MRNEDKKAPEEQRLIFLSLLPVWAALERRESL